MNPEPSPSERPKLRGVSHVWAFFFSLVSGAAIIVAAQEDAVLVATIYALSISLLLGVSGLYHTVTWKPRQLAFMRQLDHTMIFVLIAGSYTPFAVYALDEGSQTWVLITVWSIVVGAFIFNLGWANAPKWFHAALGIGAGLAGVTTLPQVARNAGTVCLVLVLLGGVFYIVGAICYALKRPNPMPGVFGPHEIFHALVILGAAAHYAAIYGYVMPMAA